MLPSPEQFAAAVGALGIDETQTIVVYDSVGLVLRAARLVDLQGDGRRATWSSSKAACRSGVAEGRPVDDEPGRPARRASSTPAPHPAPVRDLDEVRANLDTRRASSSSTRGPRARFLGEAPEPRAWVKSGRVPGSLSVPSTATRRRRQAQGCGWRSAPPSPPPASISARRW